MNLTIAGEFSTDTEEKKSPTQDKVDSRFHRQHNRNRSLDSAQVLPYVQLPLSSFTRETQQQYCCCTLKCTCTASSDDSGICSGASGTACDTYDDDDEDEVVNNVEDSDSQRLSLDSPDGDLDLTLISNLTESNVSPSTSTGTSLLSKIRLNFGKKEKSKSLPPGSTPEQVDVAKTLTTTIPPVTDSESSLSKVESTRQAKEAPKPKSWLLRFFESQVFNMSYAIAYLFTSKEPGVQQYIGKYTLVH